jgi:4,5-DOPA dioxygenase extradiol
MNGSRKHRILYLSHGGGPLPLLDDPGHQEMVALLGKLPAQLIAPRSIVVFSAHWESKQPTITAQPKPELLYDYYGFPAESYTIRYPAEGNPELAEKIRTLLGAGGFAPVLTHQRGFDHGLFVPLKLLYPQATIPCLQVSLLTGLDPAAHIRLGKALQSLLQEDILFIGSGFSFHNMHEFFRQPTMETTAANNGFDEWLQQTCMERALAESEREHRLQYWTQAPHARFCHPREEHLLPLHVCYGLARTAAASSYRLKILGKQASFFLW